MTPDRAWFFWRLQILSRLQQLQGFTRHYQATRFYQTTTTWQPDNKVFQTKMFTRQQDLPDNKIYQTIRFTRQQSLPDNDNQTTTTGIFCFSLNMEVAGANPPLPFLSSRKVSFKMFPDSFGSWRLRNCVNLGRKKTKMFPFEQFLRVCHSCVAG